MTSRTSLTGPALLMLLLPLAAAAEGIPVVAEGNELRARISLPGGIAADLILTFEQAVGLSAASIGLEASLVDPLDPALLSRLAQAAVPAAFPLLIRIEPPTEEGLSFSGPVTIAIHTHNLGYAPGTLLRLYSAPLDGPFEDVTVSVGSGSYRCRGRKGSFSELLILTDLRLPVVAIREKLERLDQTLADNAAAIDPDVHARLATLAAGIRSAHAAGNQGLAISRTDRFLAAVAANSGSAIPNVWRSSRDLVNAAGLLQAAGETLRFSLGLQSGPGPGLP